MSLLQDCRNQVRNELGATTEQKCSDAFALRHVRRRSGSGATTGERAATILELEPKDEGTRASPETLARRLKALSDVFAETGEPYAGLAAASLLRQHELERARQSFFDRAYDIIGELEIASRRVSGAADQIAEREAPLRSIDGCWLNETIRTPAHAVTDAGLQEDPRIQHIDTPRRLRPEINKTGPLLGATAYRASHSDAEGEGVIVAVIDTEIHRDHPSLTGRVFRKRNYTTEDWETPGGQPQAPHGTAVAGIIGSSANVLGMAPKITFYNYKVLPTNEAFPPGDDFDGALAIQHAMHDGVHIANCSWKAAPNSNVIMNGKSREARACNRAWRHGMVVVTSVGNDGPDPSTLTSPSDADGVIAVGATDRDGLRVPDYSSRGPTAHGLQRPHLLAPGGDTGNKLNSCTIFDQFFQGWKGTSFAAAHVSGLAALLLGRNPTLTPDQVRAQLVSMCRPLAGVPADAQGSGLIHIV